MKNAIVYIAAVLIVAILALWISGVLGITVPGSYNAIIERYTDALDQKVLIVDQKDSKIMELNKAYKKSDSLRDETEKQLAFAKTEIEALNIKLKNAKSFTTIETRVTDTFMVMFTDTVYIGDSTPLKQVDYTDGYLYQEIKYNPFTDSVSVNYSITDTIMVIDSWIRKPNNNGEQAFFLWRWLKPWQVRVDVKSKNPNSNIANSDKLIINETK